MSLNEAPEFEDTVRAAAEHHNMLPDLVRKDYWVTRVLRAVSSDAALQGTALFKGGTSLSKGWGLIDRFSEDVDLLLTGPDFGAVPENAKDREMKFRALKGRIESQTPLRLPAQGSVSREVWNWLYLRASYKCDIRYPLPGKAATREAANTDWILVEAGYRGGVQPHARRSLNSLIAQFLDTQPRAREPLNHHADDLTAFEMDLLKPERTFAEKLLNLHELMSKGDDGAVAFVRDTTMTWCSFSEEAMMSRRRSRVAEFGSSFVRRRKSAIDISERNSTWDVWLFVKALRSIRRQASAPSSARATKARWSERCTIDSGCHSMS